MGVGFVPFSLFKLEKLGVQSENELRIDTFPAVAFDLGSEIVQCMQVVKHYIKLPFCDMLPFILRVVQFVDRQSGRWHSRSE